MSARTRAASTADVAPPEVRARLTAKSGQPPSAPHAVTLLVNLAWSATHLAGSPEMLDARHVLDDHGTITTTTRDGYQRAQRLELRLVTSIPDIFHLVALTNMRRLTRARRRTATAAR